MRHADIKRATVDIAQPAAPANDTIAAVQARLPLVVLPSVFFLAAALWLLFLLFD
jgi:hypothetical protein